MPVTVEDLTEADPHERVSRPEDMHVMPAYGRPHESTCTCWCRPTPQTVMLEDGLVSRGRVWVHRETN